MPAFALLFTGVFSSLISFFGQFMARKFAFGAAMLGVMASVTAVFYGVLSTLLNGVAATLPALPGIEVAVWVAVPDALPVVFSAALSADVAVAVFQWNKQQMRMLML
jgi:hypothetical protein